MSQLIFLAILIACPVSMMFMMRGGHGGHSMSHGPQAEDGSRGVDTTAQAARILQLEREVAELGPPKDASDAQAVTHGQSTEVVPAPATSLHVH